MKGQRLLDGQMLLPVGEDEVIVPRWAVQAAARKLDRPQGEGVSAELWYAEETTQNRRDRWAP